MGRVVYDRPKHIFTSKDAARVTKAALKSYYELPVDSGFEETKKLLLDLTLQILSTGVKIQGYPDDVSYLRNDMRQRIDDIFGVTVFVQRDRPGDLTLWQATIGL